MSRGWKRSKLLDSNRKHCAGEVFSHNALEVTAQAFSVATGRSCSVATGRSKCLLELAFEATERAKSVLEHASFSFEASRPLSARNHCSSMFFLSSKALSSMLLFLSKALSTMLVVPSKSLSKSLCFELCIASSCTLCDFTGAVRRHMRI